MVNHLAKSLAENPCGATVTAGFDGYIDSILRVRKQSGEEGDSYFNTLSEFGRYVEGKSGRSCSLELKQTTEKIGGNMPIFSLALSALGLKVNCIGAAGYPDILPLFGPIAEEGRILSVCEPGKCQALEFDDGKLMLARNEDIENLDFSVLEERAGIEKLISFSDEADILAFLNWSELKGSSSIWRGFIDTVLPQLKLRNRKMFIDLSDCSHRKASDITEAVDMMRELGVFCDVTVSFNRNEAECVAEAMGMDTEGDISILARNLYDVIGCAYLIIHLVDSCYCVYNGKVFLQNNHHISKPVLSTGGGDNFNAGFVYGLAAGYGVEECMAIANTASSYYVSHGHSPNIEELISWMLERVDIECGVVGLSTVK